MDIKGYENLYSIQVDGTVCRNGKFMKHQNGRSGYKYVSLSKNDKRKNFLIHRLIAIHFIPNPENKPFINHINGIRTDNSIKNLEWCTHAENLQHAYDTGLHKPHSKKVNRGENSSRAKITKETAMDIFNATGTQAHIASKYGIAQSQVYRIKSKKRWACLHEDK